MATLTINGTIQNANGATLTLLIYDAANELVWENYPTGDFAEVTGILPPGQYTFDIMGYTQGSLVLDISGYETIDHDPPAQYDKRINDVFTLTVV